MTSINRQQPEQNREDLRGDAAVQKIKQLVKQAQNCFFCTSEAAGPNLPAARPMNVRQVDDRGDLWFLSAADSSQNAAVARDSAVTLFFQGSPHSDFLHLHGRASVSSDRRKIAELWEPVLQTWFTAGVDDPRITVIRFEPSEGYYWDTQHGNFVAGIKMLIGAALGQTLDDSIEGTIKV
jgi:general stress protein 26